MDWPDTFRRLGRGRLAVALLVVSLPLGAVAAQQLAPPGRSPATGHAQVVTQGIDELPDEEMIWRVVERTAHPRWEAKPGRRVLGFVLASDEPILLSVEAEDQIEDTAHLAPGESSFVKRGTRQIRASLGDQPVDYLSVEIVPAAEANRLGNGTLLFQSDPFTPPTGARDIDLVRNVLQLSETATVPDTGQSVYILATDGAIDVLPAGGPSQTLAAGESGIFSGDLEIEAVEPSAGGGQRAAVGLTADLLQEGGGGAGYVVAVIGDEIGPVQTPTPVPSTPEPTVPAAEQPTLPAATDIPSAPPTDIPDNEPPAELPTEVPPPPDLDGDGLTDEEEMTIGTSPRLADTDGDGLTDFDEVRTYGTDPTNRDSDGETLSDGEEINTYGTDPNNPNTDGDRLSDGREVAGGSDPNDPNDP